MKRIITNCIFLFLANVVCCQSLNAQQSSRYSIGINAGTFIYVGDLAPWRTGSWKTPGFVLGFTGHRNFSSTLAARLDLNFGKLRGDEAKYGPEYRQYRAFAFNSNVTEVVLGAEWSPLGNLRKFAPYLFGGVGYASMKVTRDYSRFNEAYFIGEPSLKEALAKDAASSSAKGIAIFPLGLGLQYRLGDRWSLHGEAAHRFTGSDQIDGFSQSGNPDQKDSYTKYSIGVRLALGGDNDPYACPPMRY
jgi:OmpA-OmpF porin, OOP family